MDYKLQLKLQAFLDGELPESEANQVAQWVAGDREAAALEQEMRHTRNALREFETAIKLPESRDFFWSKIEREIRRLETPAAEAAPMSFFAYWRRFLAPASALALVLVGGILFTRPAGLIGRNATAEIETALADAGAFTYRDYSAGTTLVWLSYPAENEVADSDEMGTFE